MAEPHNGSWSNRESAADSGPGWEQPQPAATASWDTKNDMSEISLENVALIDPVLVGQMGPSRRDGVRQTDYRVWM